MKSAPPKTAMVVSRLYLCPGHIYVGHFGGDAGTEPMTAVDEVRLVAGRGIVGDRYFDRPEGHKGQVTFFAEEVWQRLCAESGAASGGPEVFRRNVIVRGVDLLSLVGEEFEVQGVRFRGNEHCKPCRWMDQAFGPGTLARLSAWEAGGLRASILADGCLKTDRG
jgi:MOSC domain-containing protein YiiM